MWRRADRDRIPARLGVTLLTLATAAFVAVKVDSVYQAFGYVGATTSQSIIFIAPPLFLICITRRAYGRVWCGGWGDDSTDYRVYGDKVYRN